MVIDSAIWAPLGLIITVLLVYVGFIRGLEKRLTKLETENNMFMTILEPHLARIIHSPTHKRRDDLVDRYLARDITAPEMSELRCLLEQAVEETGSDKRLYFILLLARVASKIAVGGFK